MLPGQPPCLEKGRHGGNVGYDQVGGRDPCGYYLVGVFGGVYGIMTKGAPVFSRRTSDGLGVALGPMRSMGHRSSHTKS